MATDSYRLALRDLAGTEGIAGGETSWCRPGPSPSCSAVFSPGDEGVDLGDHLAVGVTFQVGQASISTRLIYGRLPGLPPADPCELPELAPPGQGDAGRRAATGPAAGQGQHHARAAVDEGCGVDLKVVSQEVGEGNETVDGDFVGEELVIAFNPAYLIDGIEAVAGDEVIIETSDAIAPGD